MKTLVIYHKADFDGLFSREICRKYYGANAEYLGWDYGDPVPELLPGQPVVMVDISVEGLMDHQPLVWIDHHKSAIERYSAKIPGYRIDGVAACRLAWQWFTCLRELPEFSGFGLPSLRDYRDRLVDEPCAVRLAGEYDIWDKRDPNADILQAALRGIELDEQMWDSLLNAEISPSGLQYSWLAVERILPIGRALLLSSDKANASLCADAAFELEWEGLRFLAINKPRGNSRTFAAGVQPQHDALLTFYWLRNKWRVSLYGSPHHPEHDLSGIAVKYGGGGHRQACGFECDHLPFALPGRSKCRIDLDRINWCEDNVAHVIAEADDEASLPHWVVYIPRLADGCTLGDLTPIGRGDSWREAIDDAMDSQGGRAT